MVVIDQDALDQFRRGPCEWCGRKGFTDPHHVFGRGVGGGLRLDVHINLVALCRNCHTLYHDGEIERADLLAVVAARENASQDEIETEIYRLRRIRK